MAGSLTYLGWRATILNPDALWLSILFLLAETIAFVLGLVTLISSSRYRHRVSPPVPPGLSVDVLVPVYSEPLDIVRRTMAAAVAIRYPHATWLLDDGDRADRRQLAEELGCRYLARRSNVGAKAGNLNYGLKHSRADFVMVLDADHVALPHALDALLGFLAEDGKVGFVQAPQDFYNTTSFQYISPQKGGGLWHDQSYFYNIAMPAADASNAASCVGTSVVYRRSALDEIGGIPTETVTEDLHTSLRLHKRGWRSVYLNESIAYGIGAPDLREYNKSRLRWGHGNIHALRVERVLTCRGLTLAQRFFYLTLGLIYLEGWQNLIVYAVPVVSLLTGFAAFQVSLTNIFIMVAFPILSYLLLQEIACGFGRYWVNELYGMIRFPIYIRATLALLRDRMAWRSSAKRTGGRVELTLMTPQLAVMAVSAVALAVAVWRTIHAPDLGPISTLLLSLATGTPADVVGDAAHAASYGGWFRAPDRGFNTDLLLVSGCWALINILRVLLFIHKVVSDASGSRGDYRFQLPLLLEVPVGAGHRYASVTAASFSRLELASQATEPIPSGRHPAILFLPAGPVALVVDVTRPRNAGASVGIVWPEGDWRERLADCLFSVDWYRELEHRHAYFCTPLELLGRPFGNRRRSPAHWQPVLYRPKGTVKPERFGLVREGGRDEPSFAAFEHLPEGAALEIVAAPGSGAARPAIVRVRGSGRSALPGHDGMALATYCAEIITRSVFPAEAPVNLVESLPQQA